MKKNNTLHKIILITVLFIHLISNTTIYAEELESESKEFTSQDITNEVSENFDIDSYIENINKYVSEIGIEGIDFEDIANSLVNSNKVDYKNIFLKLLSFFFKEIIGTLKGATSIFFVCIIMAIISNMELEKKSDITKIAYLACFTAIATISVASFIDVIASFRNVVSILTTLMQVISPFLMSVLIATGSITSTGIIQPMLLFLASAIGFIVNYVVIPFFTISVALNVISSISENLKLDKMSRLFNSSAIWIVSILLTIFLGVLSLETSLTSSVDSLAVKTTQTAMSNFVPVVGKFFSDSFETVVGATKVVSRVGGTIGIISVIIVSIVPVIKILSVMVIYMLLSAFIEPLCSEDSIVKYISSFANVYKNLLGILIGIIMLFVISTGIILNLVSSVVK